MSETTVYRDAEFSVLDLPSVEVFEDCDFEDIDFRPYDLQRLSFNDCRFNGCKLANQNLLNADMRECRFNACNLMGVNFSALRRFENPNFKDCKLNLSSFQSLKLKRIEIIDCQAVETDFAGADMSFADFSGSNLASASFNGTNLTSADFRSARDYLLDLRTARIKGAKFSLPYVVGLITFLGAEVDGFE